MTTVLITAYGPYDHWKENASWLALVELTQELPAAPLVTTRRYPVDFAEMRRLLTEDLKANYDFAIHLGQAPGHGRIALESVGLNIAVRRDQLPHQFEPLVVDGPAAYACRLPLANWSTKIRAAGIPCQVSHHAGTFLCNAAMYLSHFLAEQMQLKTQSMFMHLPLDPTQVFDQRADHPSLARQQSAAAIRLILDEMANGASPELA